MELPSIEEPMHEVIDVAAPATSPSAQRETPPVSPEQARLDSLMKDRSSNYWKSADPVAQRAAVAEVARLLEVLHPEDGDEVHEVDVSASTPVEGLRADLGLHRPQGVEWDEEAEGGYLEFVRDEGIPRSTAQSLMEWYADQEAPFGIGDDAVEAFRARFTGQLTDSQMESLIRWHANWRERGGAEDAVAEPETLTHFEAERRIAAFTGYRQGAYWDSGHPDHRAVVEEVARLHALMYPEGRA